MKAILCGDFNIAINQDIDTYNYKNINNPQAKKIYQRLYLSMNYVIFIQIEAPNRRHFTWRRNPVKQARRDFFLASRNILDITKRC